MAFYTNDPPVAMCPPLLLDVQETVQAINARCPIVDVASLPIPSSGDISIRSSTWESIYAKLYELRGKYAVSRNPDGSARTVPSWGYAWRADPDFPIISRLDFYGPDETQAFGPCSGMPNGFRTVLGLNLPADFTDYNGANFSYSGLGSGSLSPVSIIDDGGTHPSGRRGIVGPWCLQDIRNLLRVMEWANVTSWLSSQTRSVSIVSDPMATRDLAQANAVAKLSAASWPGWSSGGISSHNTDSAGPGPGAIAQIQSTQCRVAVSLPENGGIVDSVDVYAASMQTLLLPPGYDMSVWYHAFGEGFTYSGIALVESIVPSGLAATGTRIIGSELVANIAWAPSGINHFGHKEPVMFAVAKCTFPDMA